MMIRSKTALGLLALSPLTIALIVGCSDEETTPVDHTAAARSAITNTESALRGLNNAAAFLEDSKLLAKAFDEQASEEGAEPDFEFKQDADEAIDDLKKVLSEKVFIADNLESEDGNSVTYRLKPENVCPTVSEDASLAPPDGSELPAPNPPAEPQLDPECVEFLTETPVRLRVTAPREGDVDVALLVSDALHNPMTFNLHRASIGISVDLGEALDVATLLGDSEELPEKLDGTVQLELVKNAELDYSFKLNVLEDIIVAAQNEGERFEFGLGKSNGTFEARFDANQKTVKLSENVGTVSVTVPLSQFIEGLFGDAPPTVDSEPSTTPVSNSSDLVNVVLAGITGSVLLDGATDKLSFKGIGLGEFTSTVKQGDATLFALDLNQNSGRKFDFDVSLAEDGEPVVVVSPELDLNMNFAFQHVADRVQNLPAYILNDAWRVWLTGSPSPSIKRMPNDTVQVVSGEFGVSSSSAPEHNLTVAAGQCLMVDNSEEIPSPVAPVPDTNGSESEHPLSDISAAACN